MSRSPADRCTDSRSPTPAQKESNSVSPARSPIKPQHIMESQIHVGNLAEDITKEELKQKFSPFGTVADVFIIKKKMFSFGFVTFESQDSVPEAMSRLNNVEFKGKLMKCSQEKNRIGFHISDGKVSHSHWRRIIECNICGKEGHYARYCPKIEESQGESDSQQKGDRYGQDEGRKRSSSSPEKDKNRKKSKSKHRNRKRKYSSSSSSSISSSSSSSSDSFSSDSSSSSSGQRRHSHRHKSKKRKHSSRRKDEKRKKREKARRKYRRRHH